jgi:hypothetical protein
MSEAEEIILGDADMVEDEPMAMPQPIRAAAPQQAMRTPEPKKRGWFGIGRREEKAVEPLRTEPLMAAPAPRQRAQAQVMKQPEAQPRPAAQGDDLFGEHKGDEQFEIPAFLRRQQS